MPKGLIPVYGEYSDGFWCGKDFFVGAYFFADYHSGSNDLDGQLKNIRPEKEALALAGFPYACLELGGGMLSNYGKRIRIDPEDLGSISLVKLGNGNNMPGYCMYHDGENPDGKLAALNLPDFPIKEYNYQAPLGGCGQVREHYHLFRQQNLFLRDFGSQLARMPAYMPEKRPSNNRDFATLRWAMRSDGRTGFLFFSNQQPYVPGVEMKDVQFQVRTKSESLLFPSQPLAIPSGVYGIWPVHLDCDGVLLDYATAQPLSIVRDRGEAWYFLAAQKGIPVEMSFTCADDQIRVDSC